MKTKKSKKGCATGGQLPGLDMIAPALMNLIPQAINIGQSANSTPTYDPQAKGGFDFGQVLGASAGSGGPFGPLGMIAGGLNAVGQLVKSNKAKHTNVYGSPGQYADGGRIDPSVSQQDYQMKGKGNTRLKEESGRDILKRGSKGGEVPLLQDFLRAKGFYKGPMDGIYGPKTEAAVKQYQDWFNTNSTTPVSYIQGGKPTVVGAGKRNVKVDGVVGDETRAALMYREYHPSPKEDPTPQIQPVFPPGESRAQYKAEDSHIAGAPDGFNFIGGLEMLAMAAAAPLAAEGLAGAQGQILRQLGRNVVNGAEEMGGIPKPPNSPLNPTIPRGNPGMGGRSFPPKTPSSYGTRIGFATGGDMMLNNQAFQVDAPANRTDAKHYPNYNVNLDNNEVVDDARKIVYSNKIKNPITGNTFAEDAAMIERAKGKAQKKVERYKDKISEDTLSALDKQSKDLYSKQEVIATMMGKRDQNGATIQGRATGGPIDPRPGQPYMSIGGDYYYDPYGKRYVSRNPLTGSYTAEAGTPGFSTGRGFRPYAGVQGDNLITYPTTNQDKGLPNQSISNHLRQYPSSNFDVTGGRQGDNLTPSLFGATPDATRDGRTLPEVTVNGNRPGATSPRAPLPRRGQAKPATTAIDPTMPTYNGDNDPYRVANPIMRDGSPMDAFNRGSELVPQGAAPQTEYRPDNLPAFTPGAAGGTSETFGSTSTSGARSLNKFTTGDYLQMASAAASFAPLLQGPQRETPYLDNTQISKQAYDVNPQLYQSGRSYRNAVNSIDTQSPNLRRALQNGLYAQKLNADNQTVQQYQGMNNQAQSQYEANVSNQRRYNIGQTVQTNDLNRRNEGAYNTSLDNAFRTVSNFGAGMNQKQQGQDVMNLFRTQYSDVYDRIIKELTKKS